MTSAITPSPTGVHPTRPNQKVQTYGLDLNAQWFGWGAKAGSPEFTLAPDEGISFLGKPIVAVDWHTSQGISCPYFRFAFLEPTEDRQTRLSVIKLKCNGSTTSDGKILVQNHAACLVGALHELVQRTILSNLDLEDISGTLYARKGEGREVVNPSTGFKTTFKGTFIDCFLGNEQLRFQQANREMMAFQSQVNDLAAALNQPAPFLHSISNE
tara:strand:+ start:6092 stop:6730 length:639 start_codon:yes stop_codon:yes gene_type:complete